MIRNVGGRVTPAVLDILDLLALGFPEQGFGVRVVVVEPGAVITEMSGRGVLTANRLAADMSTGQHEGYDALIGATPPRPQLSPRTVSRQPKPHGSSPTPSSQTTRAPATPSEETPQHWSDWPGSFPTGSWDRLVRRTLRPYYQETQRPEGVLASQ